MPTITLLLTLCFLSNSFFLSKFSALSFTPLFRGSVVFSVHNWGPFYIACRNGFLLFFPLIAFVLVWVSFPDHSLVCQLPSHHHLPVLAMPHPIPKQRVLFCFLVHHGISIWIRVGTLSPYPSWHAPSDSNSSFPLLGGMSFQQEISPKGVWAWTP